MKVRKKPVVVDAWRIADLLDIATTGSAGLPDPVRLAYLEGLIEFEVDRITIATLEGVMTGWSGWWLIRGVKAEWYPCDQEAFDKSYDIVDMQRDVLRTETAAPMHPNSIGTAPTGYQSNPEGD